MIRFEDARRPQFEFRCLGPVSLQGADGAKLTFRTRKQVALFTFLVRRPGQPHSRDKLIDLLWSEDEISRARHSLSQATSLINKLLGCETVVAPDKDDLLLRENVIRADVAEFERCAAQHRQRDARALWRGNLLEGLWVHNAPNFERWLEAERRRLQETMRRALHELLATTRTAGDWEQMRSVAESALDLDPLDETAMLAQLVALTLLGERTLALRRYSDFEKRLADELGAEPGPEMRGWAKRQRSGLEVAAGATAGAVRGGRVGEALAPVASRALYGRTAEFARLWQAWDAARGGQGGSVVVLGPAGIGKSTLAAKLVDQVRVAGGAACVAHCFQTEKCVPFAPVSALVRQMAELPGFVPLGQVWISELGRLAPELRERFPHAPPALAADDSVRHRVCEATCRAGEAISFEEPLLLVVDNVQDADETTVALLHYFGRQAATQRTLLVSVARAGEAGEELGEFASQAKAQGYGQLQRIGPLEDTHLQRIVSDVLTRRGLAVQRSVLESIARIARGNPLHASELALDIPAEDGRLASEWLLRDTDHVRSGAERFEQSASHRLGAVSASARSVTAVLAVAARPLGEHELQAVSQLTPVELAAAVYELEAAQLLRRDDGRLGFAHDSYAPLAKATLEESEGTRIHARLAAVLAESAARDPAAQMEVAVHLEHAGLLVEARAHGLAAAEFAGSVGAVKERAGALELVRRVSGSYDGHLAAKLAACYLHLREIERLALLCAESRSQRALPRQLQDEFRYLELAADQHSGRMSLVETCDRLKELLGPENQFPHRRDAMTLLMRTADKTGDVRLVRTTARAQRRDALAWGGEMSAHALFATGYVFAKYYWPRRALPLLREAQRKAEAEQNWELEWVCREGVGIVLKQLGQFREGAAALRNALVLARRTMNPQGVSTSLGDLACVEMALGEFGAAAAHLAESAQIDVNYPGWFLTVHRRLNEAEVALENQRLDDAETSYEDALRVALETGDWRIAVYCCGGRAMCAKERWDKAALADWCERLLTISGGRECNLEERWTIEAALAWNGLINDRDPAGARMRLDAALRELARRDVDHWLRLELEAIKIEDFVKGGSARERLRRLATVSEQYCAQAIFRDAQNRLAAVTPGTDG